MKDPLLPVTSAVSVTGAAAVDPADGIHTIDGISFAGVVLLFLAIALLAALVPSRRALHIEPVSALRYE